MNTFFEKINHLSFPTVFFLAGAFTVASVLPLFIYMTSIETRLTPKAAETREAPAIRPKPTDGPVPGEAPVISRVFPWVGKAGDVVIVEGKNFGAYPKNRRIAIGDAVLADDAVLSWSDAHIEALIPTNSKQGGSVAIRIDTYPVAESLPLSFYDETAAVRLHKEGVQVTASGLSGSVRATLFTQTGKREITVDGNGQNTVILFTLLPSEEIRTLLLADEKGAFIPYSLTPTEFGF